jgi:beta-lactamase class A
MARISAIFTVRRYVAVIRRNTAAALFSRDSGHSMFMGGQGAESVGNSGNFSMLQRAVTLAGLAPALLIGATVHGDFPGYSISLPFPEFKRPAPVKPAAPAPDTLVSSLEQLIHNFGGIAGASVTSVDSGWTAAANGARRMPQQSVSKLWVTMTVLDQVDKGRIRLTDPITITRADFTLFHQPVAALVKGDVGYTATVGEIVRRAMQMSDNTCNDKLLRLVGGPDAVRAFIASRYLGEIRFGPGEKLLQSATAGLQWQPAYSMGNAFAVARSRLAPEVRKAAFDSYVADPLDGAAPEAISNALARLKRGELLSPTSTAWLVATMEAAKTGRARVHAAVPPGWVYAHKTGTGQDLGSRTAGFNDVGILTAPDGRAYALAIMIGDSNRPVRDRQMLMQQVATAIVASHTR